jgi:hypothetical protein
MREMSVTEQRYQAIIGVFGEGRTVQEVAAQWKVDREPHAHWMHLIW